MASNRFRWSGIGSRTSRACAACTTWSMQCRHDGTCERNDGVISGGFQHDHVKLLIREPTLLRQTVQRRLRALRISTCFLTAASRPRLPHQVPLACAAQTGRAKFAARLSFELPGEKVWVEETPCRLG
jgi:hypothetical protein